MCATKIVLIVNVIGPGQIQAFSLLAKDINQEAQNNPQNIYVGHEQFMVALNSIDKHF